MSRLRRTFSRSLQAAMQPHVSTRPFQSHASCYSNLKSNFYYLPTTSGNCGFRKHLVECWPPSNVGKRNERTSLLASAVGIQHHQIHVPINFSIGSFSGSCSANKIFSHGFSLAHSFPGAMSFGRAYSSHVGGKQDGDWSVPAATPGKGDDPAVSEWMDILDNVRKSAVDAAVSAGNKAKELSDIIGPYMQSLYDSHPYLKNVIVPVGGTLSATLVAWFIIWFIMPRILRKIHTYKSPLASISWNSIKEPVPYDKSLWSALEDPARYLITFMAFSQLGVMIAPTTSQYLPQAWRVAAVLSFWWFLNRWKTNFFSNAMTNQLTTGPDRDMVMAEKMLSVGLPILGVMLLAEACGVAVQSVLTVGGIGGVATAFAARDILGNALSGVSVQFSRPFSVGDNIKAGSVEGQVVEMGFTTTTLINPEKFPVIVPNSLFSSQVIINKSRAQWRASLTKIPVRIDDLDKIPLVSEEIKTMLRSNPSVYLGKDAPYCYLSRIENSFAELTLGCNLKNMRKDELYAAEQDILLKAAKIIKQHGAEMGSTEYRFNSQ